MRFQVPLGDEALAAVGKTADEGSFTSLEKEIAKTKSATTLNRIAHNAYDTYMNTKVGFEIACLLEAAQALGEGAVERFFCPTGPLHAIVAVPDLYSKAGIELAHFAFRGQHPFGQSTAWSEFSVEQL